eukprot:CAMPEP_0173058624 /NCGR_PEP_ID=MMETSP1102-20130122/1469_1 /TAXON_ID=49646 /ORGANISM="Geminigera sp., Strain Caron Lab Isolate" /LENGTH=197 /DNA_ID=CAMNT_0013924411 /DNA_START=267 /DNA_END=859 /DNA_ORIENTATION=-
MKTLLAEATDVVRADRGMVVREDKGMAVRADKEGLQRQPPTEKRPFDIITSPVLSLPVAGTRSAGFAIREGPAPSRPSLRTGNTAFKTSLALDLSIDVALVGRELMPSRTFIVRIEASRDSRRSLMAPALSDFSIVFATPDTALLFSGNAGVPISARRTRGEWVCADAENTEPSPFSLLPSTRCLLLAFFARGDAVI